MREIKQDEFDAIVNDNDKPVLVDFYATWCGPCKAMMPILESVEKSAEGEAYEFVKVDVDQSPGLSAKYGVMAVPTLAIFKNGELVYKQAGVHQPQQLQQVLNDNK